MKSMSCIRAPQEKQFEEVRYMVENKMPFKGFDFRDHPKNIINYTLNMDETGDFRDCIFDGCDLTNLDTKLSKGKKRDFSGSSFIGANLSYTHILRDATAKRVILINSTLDNSFSNNGDITDSLIWGSSHSGARTERLVYSGVSINREPMTIFQTDRIRSFQDGSYGQFRCAEADRHISSHERSRLREAKIVNEGNQVLTGMINISQDDEKFSIYFGANYQFGVESHEENCVYKDTFYMVKNEDLREIMLFELAQERTTFKHSQPYVIDLKKNALELGLERPIGIAGQKISESEIEAIVREYKS